MKLVLGTAIEMNQEVVVCAANEVEMAPPLDRE
jgi:hypothetical protein